MVLGIVIALGVVIVGFYLVLYVRNGPHDRTREQRRQDLTAERLEKRFQKRQRDEGRPPTHE